VSGKLAGKVAIVTGSAAGIGRASSLLFAREGATVIAVDRDRTENDALANQIRQSGGSADSIYADVSSDSDVRKVVEHANRAYGKIDILFNNAGIVSGGKIHTLSEEEWERAFAINVKSMFLFSRAVIPHFLNQGGGVILNTSSCTALRVVPDRALYNSTKAAVVGFTRSMAVDYAADNIRVNCLCPGTTETPSLRNRLSAMGNYDETREKFIARQPLRRLGTAEEIAQAALYLVSDDANFVTGSAFQIDGGMSL
jgi:NAD(P)-dependent dehydrogenase (short-subunit alcohol dehydrogenase family)